MSHIAISSLEAETPVAAPHAHSGSSIRRTMGLVALALLPATVFGLGQFGWPAILLFTVTVATALMVEAVSLRIADKPVLPYLTDGSALITGWLLALSLPPWAPWWIGALGSLIAIALAKQVFGGIGQNLFNPAMVARVALLIAFPLEMTSFTTPAPLWLGETLNLQQGLDVTFGGTIPDGFSGATPLGQVRTELARGLELGPALASVHDPLHSTLGTIGGSLGETSVVMLLLGGLFLLYRRVITWHIPAAMMGTLALVATLTHLIDPARYPDAVYHLVSGATLLGAFFIATDLVTSPVSKTGQLIFGAGCGVLVFAIRTWAGYPEGVAFAVMLMNACTPVIDHYVRPRIYGRDRRGNPIEYGDNVEIRP
jgi:electron transport complex protein RnfD